MPFNTGLVTFNHYRLSNTQLTSIEETVQKLTDQQAQESPEATYSWHGGKHILDNKITFSHVYDDYIHFAIKIETNKFPQQLKQALIAVEEAIFAKNNPSGFISKKQKKEARDIVSKKIEEELKKSDKYRKEKIYPILWDTSRGHIYTPLSGLPKEKFLALLEVTFPGISVIQSTPDELTLKYLDNKNQSSKYDELQRTKFTDNPESPEYPWITDDTKGYLGNEFLLWLWYKTDTKNGTFISSNAISGYTPPCVNIVLERSLDLECAYGQTGSDGIRTDGPTQTPEAKQAVKIGKLPRRTGMTLEYAGSQYILNINPETMTIQSCKLPEPDTEADTVHAQFQERISSITNLWKGINILYSVFLDDRTATDWDHTTLLIKEWIVNSGK